MTKKNTHNHTYSWSVSVSVNEKERKWESVEQRGLFDINSPVSRLLLYLYFVLAWRENSRYSRSSNGGAIINLCTFVICPLSFLRMICGGFLPKFPWFHQLSIRCLIPLKLHFLRPTQVFFYACLGTTLTYRHGFRQTYLNYLLILGVLETHRRKEKM